LVLEGSIEGSETKINQALELLRRAGIQFHTTGIRAGSLKISLTLDGGDLQKLVGLLGSDEMKLLGFERFQAVSLNRIAEAYCRRVQKMGLPIPSVDVVTRGLGILIDAELLDDSVLVSGDSVGHVLKSVQRFQRAISDGFEDGVSAASWHNIAKLPVCRCEPDRLSRASSPPLSKPLGEMSQKGEWRFVIEDSLVDLSSRFRIQDILHEAIHRWQAHLGVDLRRVDEATDASVSFGANSLDLPDNYVVEAMIGGPHFQQLLRYNFNKDAIWQDAEEIVAVACHAVGHLLGLGHSRHGEAIMFPFLRPNEISTPSSHDIAAAREIWGQ
jgi:hypothetical protein